MILLKDEVKKMMISVMINLVSKRLSLGVILSLNRKGRDISMRSLWLGELLPCYITILIMVVSQNKSNNTKFIFR
jgi:hypothetical protein